MILSSKSNKCLLYIIKYIKDNYDKLPIMEIKTENTKLEKFSEHKIINSLKDLKDKELAKIQFKYSDYEMDTFIIYSLTEKGEIYYKNHTLPRIIVNNIIALMKLIIIPIVIGYVLYLLTK